MTAVLKMTNGSAATAVELIKEDRGLLLADWAPLATEMKGGGYFAESALSDGRQLVGSQWANTIDTFRLKLSAGSTDEIAEVVRMCRELIFEAQQYGYVSHAETPVYLEAKAQGETNTRYALVINASLQGESNHYAQPFLQAGSCDKRVFDDLTLVVEHEPWTETAPGTGVATEIFATEFFATRQYGNLDGVAQTDDPTTDDEVFVSNRHHLANITNAYYYDASGPSFSGDIMTAAYPTMMLPATPAVGDMIYFGCNTGWTGSGPFFSIVFDVSTVWSDITGFVWEYYGGGAWRTFSPHPRPANIFTATGCNSVVWGALSLALGYGNDWATVAINGITAWWVRLRITGIGAAPTPPYITKQDLYSVPWGYTEMETNAIDGELPAIVKLRYSPASTKSGENTTTLYYSRMIVGSRVNGRGTNFRAFIPCPAGQLPTGITKTNSAGGSEVAATVSPWQLVQRMTPNAITPTNWQECLVYTFSTAVADDYFGAYRAFLVGKNTNYDIDVRLKVAGAGQTTYSVISTCSSTKLFELIEFGKFSIPGTSLQQRADTPLKNLTLSIEIRCSNAAGYLDAVHLVLIPIDEWGGEFVTVDPPNGTALGNSTDQQGLIVDSIEYPKYNVRSYIENFTDNDIEAYYLSKAAGRAVLQPGKAKRLWALFALWDSTDDYWRADPYVTNKVLVYRQQRYNSLRGDN